MGKTITLLFLYILSRLLPPAFVLGKPDGLTLKILHLNSPESPFYHQGNLSYVERTRSLVHQSRARAHQLSGKKFVSPETVRGVVDIEPPAPIFLVLVGIGTLAQRNPPYITYFLTFDTGSDLTWIQCEDCKARGNNCFEHTQPDFPKSKSSSFIPIPCNNHQYCNTQLCRGQFCTYHLEYVSNNASTGILAFETFTFASDRASIETVRVLFGCGYNQINFRSFPENRISGILGMGFSDKYRSFVDQIYPQSQGRFSYCVPSEDEHGHVPHTFLRFGSDIPRGHSLQSTRLYRYPNEAAYYLNLKGISLGGQRLRIPGSYFVRRSNESGCFIDSGSALSHIADFPFRILTSAIRSSFRPDSGFRVVQIFGGFDVCIVTPNNAGFGQLPNLTFHFGEANLEVKPKNLYIEDSCDDHKCFCLGILNSRSEMNVIGARHQSDHRFIYDILNMQLRFGPEDCAHNP